MGVEVINTGTELLLGSVVNTHLKFLAEALFPLGLRIARQVTVPDGASIRDALTESFGRAQIVIVTGGLGPTTDDITREITAELFGMKLVFDEKVMTAIAERFAKRGLEMSTRVRREALRPEGATILRNDHGTAPGLYFRAAEKTPHIFLLPGPPRELHPMFQNHVAPILRELTSNLSRTSMRVFRIAGLGESAVEEFVGESLLALGLELGYCARAGEVDIRIIGEATVLNRGEEIVREKLGLHIVSGDQRSLENVIVDLLTQRGETLAIAESCTGGFIAHRVTNVPGASAVFVQGFVTYSNESKTRALAVDADTILAHGAVSAETARAMAEGARDAAGADHALATTGIAGPGGGSAEKPVGTVFIALATARGETIVERYCFPTDRENFKHLASQAALDLLRRRLVLSRAASSG